MLRNIFLTGAFMFIICLNFRHVYSQAVVTHGPVVGAVTSSSASFVVRTSAEAQVQVVADTVSTFDNPVSSVIVSSSPDLDFFAKLSLDGLLADTEYYYEILVDGVPQPAETPGSFKTFPVKGVTSTFTFAFGSCQQDARDRFSNVGTIFPQIATVEPRFFLQIGDWTYPDTTDVPFNVDFQNVIDTYKSKYDPDYPMQDLLRTTSFDYVYDDHDYSSNNIDLTVPSKENSVRGYRELFPHYPLPNESNGIWHKFSFGNADFFVIDSRTQRHANSLGFVKLPDGELAFEPGPEHSMLAGDPTISGENQKDWLLRELKESAATWKFIVSPVVFNPGMRALVEFALLLQGTPSDPVTIPEGTFSAAFFAELISDAWGAGFPADVTALIKNIIDNHIENVIVLSGDTHTAAMDDGANSILPELMAGALDRRNSQIAAVLEFLGIRIFNAGGQTLNQTNFKNAYGKVTVFEADSVRLEIVDEEGKQLAQQTIEPGFLPSPVGITAIPAFVEVGEVEVGKAGESVLVVISTSSDTLQVNDIISSNPSFVTDPVSFVVPPGEKQIVDVIFSPTSIGQAMGSLSIVSNDPDAEHSPVNLLVFGEGIPAAGDLNRDNMVDVSDLLIVIDIILHRITGPPELLTRADVNEDGKINVGDLVSIVKIILNQASAVTLASNGRSLNGAEVFLQEIQEDAAGIVNLSLSVKLDGEAAAALLTFGYDNHDLLVSEPILGEDAVGMRLASKSNDNKIIVVVFGDDGHTLSAGKAHLLSIPITSRVKGATDRLFLESANLVGIDGETIVIGSTDVTVPAPLPKTFSLNQNFPNPFNPSTTISFDIPESEDNGVGVTLEIYNSRGMSIRLLVDEKMNPGFHSVIWDGRDDTGNIVSSGLYFYKLAAGEYTDVKKMLLLK